MENGEQPPLQDRSELREQAKLVRMERLLDNAKCTLVLVDSFLENPQVTVPELSTKLEEANVLHDPPAAKRFIDSMIEARNKVSAAIGKLDALGDTTQSNSANILYSSLVRGKGETVNVAPESLVRLNTRNPLAITLEVNSDRDFKRIDSRTNIGGFFNEETRLSSFDKEPYVVAFPLVVINGISSINMKPGSRHVNLNADKTLIFDHEAGHSRNRTFINALRRRKTKIAIRQADGTDKMVTVDSGVVWGAFEDFESRKKDAALLITQWSSNPDEARNSLEWQSVIGYSLHRAKDELLADVEARDSLGPHAQNVLAKNNAYDYFAKRLDILPGTALYDALWKEYSERIKKNEETAEFVLQQYRRAGLSDRAEVFKWVLAQIPLEKWDDQLHKTLFVEEAEHLKKIGDVMLDRDLITDTGVVQQIESIYVEFQQYVLSNEVKPLVVGLREYSTRITAMIPPTTTI